MRTPTDRGAAWEWWRQNIGRRPDAIDLNRPQPGLYRGARGRRAVPVMIDITSPVDDDTGELCGDEVFVCTVDGAEKDAFEVWGSRLTPISEKEFEALQRVREATRDIDDISGAIII